MFEMLGLGVNFEFKNGGQSGLNETIAGMDELYKSTKKTTEEMQEFNMGLTALGAGLSAGVTAPIVKFTKSLVSAGTTRASFVQDTTIGFKALMGSAKEAGQYMSDMLDFAKTTPFSFMGLTAAAQEMNTYGIESKKVFDILQTVGDYAGGSGKGESALSGITGLLSIINSEGGAGTIRLQQLARYGINAAQIIGNLNNLTSEDAATEYIKQMSANDFTEQLLQGIREGTDGLLGATSAYNGMMGELKNTWTGANDSFRGALQRVGLELMGEYRDDEGMMQYKNLDALTRALNNITTSIKVVGPLFEPLISKVFTFLEKGSEMVKAMAEGFAKLPPPMKTALSYLTGALTLLGPALLFVGGLWPKISKWVMAGVGVFKSAGTAILNLKGSMIAFGQTLKGMGPVIGQFMGKMAGLALTFGSIYFIWKYDIFGIRGMLESFVTTVKTSLSEASRISQLSADEIAKSLQGLDASNDFGDKLTAMFVRIGIAWESLRELFTSGDFTISDELYEKLVASGMEPVVTSIAMLVYRMSNFLKGFKDGLVEGAETIRNTITTVFGPPFIWLKDHVLAPATKALTDFMIKVGIMSQDSALLQTPANQWEELGRQIGFATSFGIAIIGISKLIGIFVSIGKAIGVVVSIASKLLPILKGIATAVAAAVSAVGIVPIAIAAAVIAVIALIVYFWDDIKAACSTFISWVSEQPWFIGLQNALAEIGNFFVMIWDNVKSIVQVVADWFVYIWEITVGKAQKVWDRIVENWNAVVGQLQQFWNEIVAGVEEIKQSIIDAFTPAVEKIRGFFELLGEFFTFIGEKVQAVWSVISPVVEAIASVVMGTLTNIWNAITSVFGAIFTTISDIVTAIVQVVIGTAQNIWGAIKGVLSALFTGIGGAVSMIWGIITGFFGGIINLIMGRTTEAKESFLSIWTSIKTGLGTILGAVWKSITSVFGGIGKQIKTLLSGVWNIIKAPFVNAWEWLTEDFLPNMFDIGSKMIDAIANGIKSAGSKVWNAITGLFKKTDDELLPHSDAKTGPLSDLTGSGKAIPETMAAGVRSASSELDDAIKGLNSPSMSNDYELNVKRNMMPSTSEMDEYSRRMNDAYSSRYDYSTVDNSQRSQGVTLQMNAGAIQISIPSNSPQEVRSMLPEVQANLEATIIDIIRKLKDEQYEM